MASLYDIVTIKGKQYYRLDGNIVKTKDVPQAALDALNPEDIVDENGMIVVDQKSDEQQQPTEDNLKEVGVTKLQRREQKPKAGADEEKTKEEDDTSDEDSDQDSEDEEAPDDSEDDSDSDDESQDEQPQKEVPQKPARAAQPEPVGPSFKSSVPQSRPGMDFPRVNGKTVDIFDGRTPHTHLKNVGGIMVPLSADSFRTKSDGQILGRLKELGKTPIDFAALEAAQSESDARGGNAPVGGNAGGMILDDDESDDSGILG